MGGRRTAGQVGDDQDSNRRGEGQFSSWRRSRRHRSAWVLFWDPIPPRLRGLSGVLFWDYSSNMLMVLGCGGASGTGAGAASGAGAGAASGAGAGVAGGWVRAGVRRVCRGWALGFTCLGYWGLSSHWLMALSMKAGISWARRVISGTWKLSMMGSVPGFWAAIMACPLLMERTILMSESLDSDAAFCWLLGSRSAVSPSSSLS